MIILFLALHAPVLLLQLILSLPSRVALKYNGVIINNTSATIELFKEDSINYNFTFYDSVIYNGGYNFSNVPPGNYLIKASLHGLLYPHIIPTYFDSVYSWQLADTCDNYI